MGVGIGPRHPVEKPFQGVKEHRDPLPQEENEGGGGKPHVPPKGHGAHLPGGEARHLPPLLLQKEPPLAEAQGGPLAGEVQGHGLEPGPGGRGLRRSSSLMRKSRRAV